MATVNEYLATATAAQKAEFERVRKLVKEVVSEVEEVISYGIPTFKCQKKPLLYFGVFKDHMSLFPTSDGMIETIGPELEKFRTGKGTLQFSESRPLSDDLIKKIIAYRLANIDKS